jgi:hypothetical protein
LHEQNQRKKTREYGARRTHDDDQAWQRDYVRKLPFSLGIKTTLCDVDVMSLTGMGKTGI